MADVIERTNPPYSADEATMLRAFLDYYRATIRRQADGLTPEQLSRVFERFYRADPSRGRTGGGGSGLGLAIVAAIVSQHHGRVGVAQTPGGGATFVVRLPQETPSR